MPSTATPPVAPAAPAAPAAPVPPSAPAGFAGVVPAAAPAAPAPHDGEGCEAVTILIAATHVGRPEYARTAACSVRQNLVGADALVLIMAHDPETTMVAALRRQLDAVPTERIILMTDNMLILNPTTIYELGCRRAIVAIDKVPTPMLMHKSALAPLLDYMLAELPYADVMLEYDRRVRSAILPVLTRPWNADNWLLPVVSDSPAPDVLRKWAATQRFLFINRPTWPPTVKQFLDENFPL